MLSGFSVFHPPGQTKFSRPKQKSTPSPSRVPLSLSVIQLCSNYAYLLRRPRSYNVSAGCVEMGKSQISRGTGRPELESLANIYFPFKGVFCSPPIPCPDNRCFFISTSGIKRETTEGPISNSELCDESGFPVSVYPTTIVPFVCEL